MGNYIKHQTNGNVIKIGVLDETFFSRKTLLRFRELGYKGFYNGEFNKELDEILNTEKVLFGYMNEPHFIEWELENKVFWLPAAGVKHDPVIVNQNGYQYKLNCTESDQRIIKAKLVGECFSEGQLTSVFSCDCCGKLFTITHLTAMFLRNVLPMHKQYINSKYDAYIEEEDISLAETMEVMIDSFSHEEMLLLLKNGDWSEEDPTSKEIGKSLAQMYEEAKRLSDIMSKEMGIDE